MFASGIAARIKTSQRWVELTAGRSSEPGLSTILATCRAFSTKKKMATIGRP